ncbi:MAG: hypothetical protein NTZ43_07995 [Gemmatimonadetes bacterium]|nr:hypothetical protein [Gemmatimonadota bacterium]
MATSGKSDGLRIIFSFFLGLMLTAFVGVGVYTFHAPPDQYETQLRDLSRREQALRESRPASELPASDRDQIKELNRERAALLDKASEARKPWVRSTSVILMVFATILMAVSLVRADQLPVISNGLLLGGVFTMLYGVGWIIGSDDSSVARFLVMAGALAITMALGYVRFVRRGAVEAASSAAGGSGGADSAAGAGGASAELERRVSELEARLNEAAQAMGPR